MLTCNPWEFGGVEASVDGAVGVGGAAADHEEEGTPPCSCHPDLF